ncbi:MAG: citrate/2-methylcitrate synthase [Gemmatimonadota bacterium]
MAEIAAARKPAAGLQGVVVADSEISYVDGQAGHLVYRGYSIEDLAANSTFEETAKLLLDGTLPSRAELDQFDAELIGARGLGGEIIELIRAYPVDAQPMAVLRTAVSALGLFDPDTKDIGSEATRRKAIRLVAKFPTIVAAFERHRNGHDPIGPRGDLGHAANFLYMLNGSEPDPEDARVMDVCLILHAEHGMNASTFSARVTAATLSDIHSAITSAVGTLKGALHGGANQEVMKMLLEIDQRGIEPADQILETMAAEKGIDPNVDFFSASTYHALGIPTDLFTPIFAISRVSGWSTHVEAQYRHNRLIRPRAKYVGPRDLTYVPIEKR